MLRTAPPSQARAQVKNANLTRLQERIIQDDGKLKKDIHFSPFETVPRFDPKSGRSYNQLQGYVDIDEICFKGTGFKEVDLAAGTVSMNARRTAQRVLPCASR